MTQANFPFTSSPGARRLVQTLAGQVVREGAGVRNVVAIGMPPLTELDPFLLFAEFGGEGPQDYAGGFPDHPHRGFETLTYVLEGRVRHADSRGNAGRLGPGAVQRMKAARGIRHAEMPDQPDGRLRAFQVWLNLPARHKMDDPGYQDVPDEDVPRMTRDGVTVKALVGSALGLRSPISGGVTELLFLDVALSAGANLTVPTPPGHAAFAVVYSGRARFVGGQVAAGSAALFSAGDALAIGADEPTGLLLLAARPIGEPIARHGPFVMNTPQEIHRAIADLRAGRLG